MEWFEIIELRSTVLDKTALRNELKDILLAIKSGTDENRIKLLGSNSIDTDFCVCIEHFSGPPMEKSKLGRHIYLVLKKFGLINHKIWIRL